MLYGILWCSSRFTANCRKCVLFNGVFHCHDRDFESLISGQLFINLPFILLLPLSVQIEIFLALTKETSCSKGYHLRSSSHEVL